MLKEEFKSDSSRDFHARYGGTFGWYERAIDDRLLVQLKESDQMSLHFEDQNGIKYEAQADKGNVFCFIPVERKLHNVDGDVWMTSRIPARQWKRGMCAANTRIHSLSDNRKLPVNFSTISNLFANSTEQERAFRKGMAVNIAISDSFAIVGSKVYLYDIEIGVFKKEQIVLNDNLFIQEVKDVVSRNKYDITVLVK